MQLFKGSYFSVGAGSTHLWPTSVMASGTMYVNRYTCFKVKYKKSQFSKVYKWNVNKWYKDIGFNLKVCVTVFLEAWTRAAFLKLYRANWFHKHALVSLVQSSTDL